MEWWQLVFALVVIAAYVIKHIVAVQQEQQRPRERPASAPPVVAKSDEEMASEKTELDRRFEEAVERRRDLEDRPISSPLPRRSSIPMPAPTVVKPAPRYQAPARRRPEAVKPVVAAAPPMPVPTVVEKIALVVPVHALPRQASPAAGQVLELLKDRRNLAAAVVLREVLDRPLSRRRRHV
jgi:hypothetical protein